MFFSIIRIKKVILVSSVFVSVIFLFGCASNSVTESTRLNISTSVLDKILDKEVIRVGTTGDYLPFSYQKNQDSNQYYGVDIALAIDLGRSLDVEVQFVKTSWPTLMEDLLSDKFDIAMSGITITLDRQKKGFFSIPVNSSGKAAITKDENVDFYKTISSINQSEVRVIVNPGGTNEIFTKANFPNATIIINEDNLSIFQKIVDGKADVMVTDVEEILVQELLHPELDGVNTDKPFNFFEKGFLLPRDLVFKAYIDQWLNLRKKDGTFQRIFDEELERIQRDVLKEK